MVSRGIAVFVTCWIGCNPEVGMWVLGFTVQVEVFIPVVNSDYSDGSNGEN